MFATSSGAKPRVASPTASSTTRIEGVPPAAVRDQVKTLRSSIGNGPDILTKVTCVGHDLKLDEGVGVRSKAGQSVPVGVGLPTILASEITVGGTRQ